MFRCLELARLAAGHVAPNPMVGALLVFEDRIIGEGYHRQYGEAHAEVNCLASVKPEDRHLIPSSTLYVSLEPCAHFGKTPPCADLIIRERIPRVVISCRDPFPAVDGKGMEKLRAAGVDLLSGVLEQAGRELNKRFFVFHTRHRPYIVLKWAQTANGKLAADGTDRLRISNDYSNRLVHKWRTEEAAILIGTNTAELDDPSLTARLWTGPNPIRLVIDSTLRLPPTLQVFDGKAKTIIFNKLKHDMTGNPAYYQIAPGSSLVRQVSMALVQLNTLSVLVEGGTTLLQSFIDEGYWDEARIITNEELVIPGGHPAPVLGKAQAIAHEQLHSDRVALYKNPIPS
jgi:diaminohydroxyphosphoribosylaminopyrimidine deaminase / 5-amino-6-(5-phosphoribosylamino)uracil reductase